MRIPHPNTPEFERFRDSAVDAMRAHLKPGDRVYQIGCCGDVYFETTNRAQADRVFAFSQALHRLSGREHTPAMSTYVWRGTS